MRDQQVEGMGVCWLEMIARHLHVHGREVDAEAVKLNIERIKNSVALIGFRGLMPPCCPRSVTHF
jgi:hypothetical protein